MYGKTTRVRGLVAASAANAESKEMTAARLIHLGRTWAVITRPSFSTSPPESRRDSTHEPRAYAPQRDLRDQHHRYHADQPWPKIEGQPRSMSILEEGLLRLRQAAPACHLRELAKQGLVHSEVPELLPIRYH